LSAAAREARLAWLLCAPAAAAMLLVTAYPIAYAVWLSLFRYDLRFPEQRAFVGLGNYASVLGSEVWWQAVVNTLIVTFASVTLELVLGFVFALLMHRALFGRRVLRTALLVPYGIVTVVAALAWRLAFDPTTGFVNRLLDLNGDWLAERGTAFAVIVFAEVWKTTPFMALLLLAGFTLVPADVLNAARVDGATRAQTFFRVTLPLMRPAVVVALLFRTLDAFRVFDTVFVLTGGSQDTASVSIVAYRALITRLNLGLGSAVAVIVFACVVAIATLVIALLGVPYAAAGDRRR
jgi:multiple sugar transport system permease protein